MRGEAGAVGDPGGELAKDSRAVAEIRSSPAIAIDRKIWRISVGQGTFRS